MIKVIGHRGASGYALENSFEAFKMAVQHDVDMIEVDVQLTKDNKLIVFHDSTLDRLTNHKGYTSDYTYAQLSRFKLKNGSRIPLLDEVCDYCNQFNLSIFVELKIENIHNQAAIILESRLLNNQFIIGSFYHKQISDLKKNRPNIQTAIIFEGYPLNLYEYVKEVNPDFVSVGFESISQGMIDEIHCTGKKLLIWTVNNEVDIVKAISYKPYGLLSNFPDILRDKIRSHHFITETNIDLDDNSFGV